MSKHKYLQHDDFECLLYISTLSFKLKYAERSTIIHIAASAKDVTLLRVEVIKRRELRSKTVNKPEGNPKSTHTGTITLILMPR